MTTKTEIEKTIKEAEAKLAEAKKQLAELDKPKKKSPFKEGEQVWCINTYNQIDYVYWYGGNAFYKRLLRTKNAFRTRADAELYKKIDDRVHKLIGDWEPDWFSNELKWFFSVDREIKSISRVSSRTCQNQGITYMPRQAAETLQREFTDKELTLWICGGVE